MHPIDTLPDTPYKNTALMGIEELSQLKTKEFNGKYRIKFLQSAASSLVQGICRLAAAILSLPLICCQSAIPLGHWKWAKAQGEAFVLSLRAAYDPSESCRCDGTSSSDRVS